MFLSLFYSSTDVQIFHNRSPSFHARFHLLSAFYNYISSENSPIFSIYFFPCLLLFVYLDIILVIFLTGHSANCQARNNIVYLMLDIWLLIMLQDSTWAFHLRFAVRLNHWRKRTSKFHVCVRTRVRTLNHLVCSGAVVQAGKQECTRHSRWHAKIPWTLPAGVLSGFSSWR